MQVERQRATPLAPQPVGDPVALEGMESLEVKQRRREEVDGGVTILYRADVGGHSCQQLGFAAQGQLDHLAQGDGRHCGAVELVGELEAQRRAQITVIENGGVKEAGQHGLLGRHALRFLLNFLPRLGNQIIHVAAYCCSG